VAAAGCSSFVVHARKAWLHGVSPKDNRTLPPLCHDRVARLKRDFPALEIIVNGGITSIEQVGLELARVDGVMIGREAYRHPYLMAQLDRIVYGENDSEPSRAEAVRAYVPYVERELTQGTRLHHLTRHVLGLYQGEPGASRWRRELTTRSAGADADAQALLLSLAAVHAAQGPAFSTGGRLPKSVSAEAAI
jgi:tRNA-dihydrouridine synthase A